MGAEGEVAAPKVVAEEDGEAKVVENIEVLMVAPELNQRRKRIKEVLQTLKILTLEREPGANL